MHLATRICGSPGVRPADAVVAEIRKAGGEAVANYDDVLNGARIVETAIKTWGRIDILVNNAGILRDSTFGKMNERDWDRVMQVSNFSSPLALCVYHPVA